MAAKTASAPIGSRLWSVKEVAEFLALSEKTVWRWHEAGKLPPGRKLPGRAVRWDPAKIKTWFEKQPAA